jgi:hypothetical protein
MAVVADEKADPIWKVDAFPEAVATINDSGTGNDVIEGRQPSGAPHRCKTASLRLWADC